MTCVIICTAASLDATNALLRGKPFNASGDNVSVPIVIEAAAKEQTPQFYLCNWEAFSDEHFAQLKAMAKNVAGLYVYDGGKEKGFDQLLKRLRIKRKEMQQ